MLGARLLCRIFRSQTPVYRADTIADGSLTPQKTGARKTLPSWLLRKPLDNNPRILSLFIDDQLHRDGGSIDEEP